MPASPKRRARSAADVEIRPAGPAELPALALLGAKLAREHHGWDPERFFLPEEPIEDGYVWWLGKELANPRAVVLGAWSGSAAVGYAYGRIEPRDWNRLRDRCGVGVDLWVEPEARGAGLGPRLLETLADALARRGAQRVVIDVAARNPAAARIFRRMGFRPTMTEMTRETAPPGGAKAPERGGRAAPARRKAPPRRPPASPPRARRGRASRRG